MESSTMEANGELFKTEWFKSPNALVDVVCGSVLSPSAVVVVMTVIRYTQGMGGRQSAQIPTETFKRVLGTNRDKTAYKFVDEAIESGLIIAEKKRGMVTTYSVNTDPNQWRKVPLAESATGDNSHLTTGEKRHTSSGEKRPEVVAKSATLIKSKDLNKDIKESAEAESFNRDYEMLKERLMISGLLPIGQPINDAELKPEIYKCLSWSADKDMDKQQKIRLAVSWLQKLDKKDLAKFFTFDQNSGVARPHENRSDSFDQNQAPKLSKEQQREADRQAMEAAGV